MAWLRKTSRAYQLPKGVLRTGVGCSRLGAIYYVAHLATAVRILEDGRVTARRVDDDSRLDRHRVSVVWTAPNRWPSTGSRYGTVEFAFDFARLMEGRSLYWVEAVEDRSRGTCRLLVSASDVSGLPVLRYDPVRTKGPLRLVDGQWFWRNDLGLELMVHGHLPTSLCGAVAVVGHHRDFCQRGPVAHCPDASRAEDAASAALLAGAMAGRYRLPPGSLVADRRVTRFLESGWSGVVDALDAGDDGDDVFERRVRRKGDTDVLVASALLQLSQGRDHQAADAAALASGAGPVRSALKRLLRGRTGVRIGSPHGATIALRPDVSVGSEARADD